MDQLELTANQCRTLYSALKHYGEYLNQPNEMAEDNVQKRKEIQELINYFNDNTSLGVRRYRLEKNGWQIIAE